jgi:oxygen-independent coproporphyrinogen-3 oxidase
MTDGAAAPDHVYVHVPFCGRRCAYCDFSIAVRREVPVRAFNDAIMAELVTRRIGPNPRLKTLYLGGGTPSKLGGDGLAELVASLRLHLMGATFQHSHNRSKSPPRRTLRT